MQNSGLRLSDTVCTAPLRPKVEYLSNNWSDITQIRNFNEWDQTRVYRGYMTYNGRRPTIEDDLKKVI